jgi:bacteriorhodopsin
MVDVYIQKKYIIFFIFKMKNNNNNNNNNNENINKRQLYNLNPYDLVGISFWVIPVAMIIASVFFALERFNFTNNSFKTGLTISSIYCLASGLHYFQMRDLWVNTADAPIVYRYVDWFITKPLQIMLPYFLLASGSETVPLSILRKLIFGILVYLIGGYMGEAGIISAMVGFILMLGGWGFTIYQLFLGEAGKLAATLPNILPQFNSLRMIITIGWAIYVLGYSFRYLMGGVDANSLNIIYNLSDIINKIIYGVIFWSIAK